MTVSPFSKCHLTSILWIMGIFIMKNINERKMRRLTYKALWILFFAQAAFLILKILFAQTLNLSQEELNTINITHKFWEKLQNFDWSISYFYPINSLSNGLHDILELEFPILNILTSPLFLFGKDLAIKFIAVFYVLINFLLYFLNIMIWKPKHILGDQGHIAFLLLPFLTINLIYNNQCSSHISAALIILLAIGLSWEKTKLLRAFLLSTLGLLIQPSAILLFSIMFIRKRPLKYITYHLVWMIPAILLSSTYYTLGMRFMAEDLDVQLAKPLVFRDLSSSAQYAYQHIFDLSYLILQSSFVSYFGFLTLLLILLKTYIAREFTPSKKLWLLYFLKVLIIIFLFAPHLQKHEHYIIALTPIASLIITDTFSLKGHIVLKGLFVLQFIASLIFFLFF